MLNIANQLKLGTQSEWPSSPIIFVVSSTGNGDPPQNAESFWRVFKRLKGADSLSHVSYFLLGLGDSNYDTFLGFPYDLDTKLKSLGATLIGDFGKADEATGLEDTVEPWIADLYPTISEHIAKKKLDPDPPQKDTQSPLISTDDTPEIKHEISKDAVVVTENIGKNTTDAPKKKLKIVGSKGKKTLKAVVPKPTTKISEIVFVDDKEALIQQFNSALDISKENPFTSKVLSSRLLTSEDAKKQVLEVTLDISGSNLDLVPGDALGLFCPNDESTVSALIARLGVTEPKKLFILKPKVSGLDNVNPHIKTPCSVFDAFLNFVDITSSVSKRLLMTLKEYATDEKDKAQLERLATSKEDYFQLIETPRASLLDILNMFPSCKPDLAHLLDSLPPLMPRYFSITNSLKIRPEQARFSFVVVNFPLPEPYDYKYFRGVCTTYIHDTCKALGYLDNKLIQPMTLPIFLRNRGNFILSEDPTRPIIMVGPGTGVAPFIGFLEEREYLRDVEKKTLGPAILFSGHRHPEKDWLYKDELKRFEENKVLTKWVTAFSRFEDNVVYVTHKIKEMGSEIYDYMMNKNAIFYICGDAKTMAKDLRELMISIIHENANVCEKEAADILQSWVKEQRYLLDVWS